MQTGTGRFGDRKRVKEVVELRLAFLDSHLWGWGDVEQEIRFCTAGDGVRIAYATVGSGDALVKPSVQPCHLEYEWRSPVLRHW